MSNHSGPTKTAHLSMPYGMAMHKLRKMLIFHLAKRLGEDFCFKYAHQIETVEEFSIEHKAPWLHGNLSLFWDRDNIAFFITGAIVPTVVGVRSRNQCPLGQPAVFAVATFLK